VRVEVLVVDCPSCGAIFESALGVERITFDFMKVVQMLELCPECRAWSRFDKNQYWYQPRR
jgi:uncharacterized protein (UPF0212 family)